LLRKKNRKRLWGGTKEKQSGGEISPNKGKKEWGDTSSRLRTSSRSFRVGKRRKTKEKGRIGERKKKDQREQDVADGIAWKKKRLTGSTIREARPEAFH